MEADYHEFTTLPQWTRAVYTDDGVRRHLENDADPYKWSGEGEPPAIGATVNITINNIGPGTVISYFAEQGWLGCIVAPHNPPKWYIKQNGPNTAGHVFGAEIKNVTA